MQDELIIRHLTGEASAEEEQQLRLWMARSPENEKHYDDLKKVLELSSNHVKQVKQDVEVNIDQEWKRFVSSIEKETPVRTLAPEAPLKPWLRIAAALFLVAVSGFVINYFLFRNTETHVQTSDNIQSVSLPDGSTVILNKHSELSYTSSFGEKNRAVTLKGEAFFDVAKDPQKPFVIAVNQAEIEVLGTSFNVQGYDDRKEMEVTVQTGLVKFSVPEMKREVKLAAGSTGIYVKAQKELSSAVNSDVNFLAWNTRRLVFTEDNLRSVIETLNKTYQVNITMPLTISPSCVVTVTFDHQSLESILSVLKTTLNLEYTITGNQIEIISAGC
jgi:transmembrane sensor